MANYFAKNHVCTQEIKKLYPIVEQKMLPFIRAKAAKLKRLSGMDFDDVVQEGRMALLKGITKYASRGGDKELERYVGRVLTNAFHLLLYEQMAQCRMPKAVVQLDNEWVKISVPPISLDYVMDIQQDKSPNPEEQLNRVDLSDLARLFRLKMFNLLTGRDLDVFNCKVNPPMDLLIMIRNLGGDYNKTPSNVHIAKYLGVNKSAIDYSLHNIRLKFTQVAKFQEFSDLFPIGIRKGWAMIHTSQSDFHDVEYIKSIIESRNLNPKPLKDCQVENDYYQRFEDIERLVERYEWGCVLYLRYYQQHATIVVEGELNHNQGVTYGVNGTREKINLPWYNKLLKKIKEHTMSKKLPCCVGLYDSEDDTCNGIPNCEENPPCHWKSKCSAFALYLESTKQSREEHLEIVESADGEDYALSIKMDVEDFVVWCDDLAKGVEKTVLIDEVQPKSNPTKKKKKIKTKKKTRRTKEEIKKTKAKIAKASSASAKQRAEYTMELFEHFMAALYSNFEEKRRSVNTPGAGQFYAVDRRNSGYISVYCAARRGRDLPLVMLLPKPRLGILHIELPFESEIVESNFTNANLKKFGKITTIKDGSFLTKFDGFDKEKLSLLAEELANLVNRGIIELPEVL